MKFKTRIYLGFCCSFVLFILIQLILMIMLYQLNHNMKYLVKEYEMLKLANTIQNELNIFSRESRGILANPPSELKIKFKDTRDKALLNANVAIETLQQLDTREESQELIRKFKNLSQILSDMESQSDELIKAGMTQEVTQLFWYDSRRTREQMVEVVDKLQMIQEKAMDGQLKQYSSTYNLSFKLIYVYVILGFFIGMGVTFWIIRNITDNLNRVTSVMTSVALDATDKLPRIDVTSKDEIGAIAIAFNDMAQTLEEHAKKERELKHAAEEHSWLKSSIAEIATMYPGVENLQNFAHLFITKVTPMVGASYGVFYMKQEVGNQQKFNKLAAYAYNSQDRTAESFRLGEGLVGQCAVEKRMIQLTEVPNNYIKITSGIGNSSPASILIIPIIYEEEVLSVIELASFEKFTPLHFMLLQDLMSSVGMAIKSILRHMQIKTLLQESQTLTAELQSQSEELQLQQEELRTINEQLEEQYASAEQKTEELEKTRRILENKAQELTLSSQYKSEFLANMSHELRTPLNSLLILAQMLAENADGNLTTKQVEFAQTIFSSGSELVHLINDILDLSKVESGKMEVIYEEVRLSDVQEFVESKFIHFGRQKEIHFSVQIDNDVPMTINTDKQRLQQILNNLLYNAFKFTERGTVSLNIKMAGNGSSETQQVDHHDLILAFSVRDTGIGIAKEKQDLIFEAFKQADGTTSRKYGGTGLGLSISREIAHLLGGYLEVNSQEGEGSTFTLYLPSHGKSMSPSLFSPIKTEVAAGQFEDPGCVSLETSDTPVQSDETWTHIKHGNALLKGKKILVVDDDMRNVFALTTALESHDMEIIFAENGREGLDVLKNNPDTDLILMDIMMPEMDGFEAIRAIRQIIEFKTLPIIALTALAMKHDRTQCIEAGASDYISKPVNVEQLLSLISVWLYK